MASWFNALFRHPFCPNLLATLGLLIASWGLAPVQAQPLTLPELSIRGTSPDIARQAVRDVAMAPMPEKHAPAATLSFHLALLHRHAQRKGLNRVAALADHLPVHLVQGRVLVDAIAVDDADALRADLEALGLEHGAVAGSVVSGALPIARLAAAAELPSLRFLGPSYAVSGTGSVTSQGDAAMWADLARDQAEVDGTGITACVMSDSYDHFDPENGTPLTTATDDIATGDLPADGVFVLDDTIPGDDEGRAMLQIVHDVAPGAALGFHTAFGGQANFAEGILELADAGCHIIVDDVLNSHEPMFQDGIIAQAVSAVVDQGVTYVTMAYNLGTDAYESGFVPADSLFVDGAFHGLLHDFDPGPAVDLLQHVTLPPQTKATFTLQWDGPHASAGGFGAPNDLDLFLLSSDGSTVVAASMDRNVGVNAVESITVTNADDVSLPLGIMIAKYQNFGPDPSLMKVFDLLGNGTTIDEFQTPSPTIFGHNNAADALTVGAANYTVTPHFSPGLSTALVADYSSRGGVPILFDGFGQRLATPVIRPNPDLVGPDAGNTTFFGTDADFDGFPNFFGTSAAAPHVAGVAALMLDVNPVLPPNQVYDILRNTAIDMDDPDTPDFDTGFDVATGFGFVRADWAVDPELLPVELTSFTATPNGANILLEWRTASETSNAGFEVERKRGEEDQWRKIGFVEGTGTTAAPQSYHFTDTAVPFEAETLAYRLRQIDFDGAFEYSPVVELALTAPARFALEPNFPNPFARQTTIRYTLPHSGPVRLTVYDVLGREVAVLIDREEPAGRYEQVVPARSLASGVYFVRLQAGKQIQTQRMTVVR